MATMSEGQEWKALEYGLLSDGEPRMFGFL